MYGIGSPAPIRPLQDALSAITSRENVVFVNNGFSGGEIEQIITSVGNTARAAGKTVMNIDNEEDLVTVCRNSLRGASNCIAGIVFHSTPTQPEGAGKYNYTLRFDGALGASIDVNTHSNDQDLFVLPLQKAIDSAIATVNGSLPTSVLETVDEYPYTNTNQEERAVKIRVRYMSALINILGVAFFIGICGIQYQQVGAQATEREGKMAQLLEVMMPNKRRWEPQIARLASYHIAFTLLYLPGWIIMAVILQQYVFARTSVAIVIVFHILTGLSLASFSLFAAAFFKKAQLSGITTILVSLVLAIIAQVFHDLSNGAVIITSLLFPSMNYTYFIILMARFEAQDTGTNMTKAAPENTWSVTGIAFWVLLVIQIVVYPILAVIVERVLWGTTSGDRHLSPSESGAAVELQNFSKHFRPTWFQRNILPIFKKGKKDTVIAVDDLSLSVRDRQITLLLGANGSGKSTTLDAIAGLSKPTNGSIALDFSHGLGFCPQQNVLWKDLTVREHIDIFDRLKSIESVATKEEKIALIRDCDLHRKIDARAGSLSGGQMRKLQLASMFIGKSRICLVDECSSGIDPLARRKIQDILLAERSRSQRTIIFTSHYLDEADIADYILIMSKGQLKIHGTAPEIKQSGQYRIHIYHTPNAPDPPHFDGVAHREMYDQTVYVVEDAAHAAELLSRIEAEGFQDYTVSGPTVEDAFMRVAEEMVPSLDKTYDAAGKDAQSAKLDGGGVDPETSSEERSSNNDLMKALDLQTGTQIGPFRQGAALFWKRFQVFLRNIYPNLAVLLIIPIAAGLASLFLKHFVRAGCTPADRTYQDQTYSLSTTFAYSDHVHMVVGPRSQFNQSTIDLVLEILPDSVRSLAGGDGGGGGGGNGALLANITRSLHFVDTLDQFNGYISANYHNVTGGFFLGEPGMPSTVAYQGNKGIYFPVILQNLLSTILLGSPIATSYQAFDIPWEADQGNTLQYCMYFGLVLCIVPAFFALYPTMERLRHVRGLHYSNGVRALPLWLSYTAFDFCFILVGSSIAAAILAGAYDSVFFELGLFWLVIVFFGLCATLFSYVVSLYARSQLGAFAIAAAYQAVTALLYIIAYLSTVTYGKALFFEA